MNSGPLKRPTPPGSPGNTSPNSDSGALTLLNDRLQIERAELAVLDAAERHGFAKASRFAIKLALEEAIANAFRHGHANLSPDKPVSVSYSVGPGEVRVSVEDQGPGFDPGTIPDPTLDENLENPSGRGIMLIRAYMTSVSFNTRGNRVDMVYRKPASA